MLTRLADWLRRRRDHRAAAKAEAEGANKAVSLARSAFGSSYPDRQALDRCSIDLIEDGYVVTLLHEYTLPPRRSWWQVDMAGHVIELPYDKAAMRIHIPVWR